MRKSQADILSKICTLCHVGTYHYYGSKNLFLKCTLCGHAISEEKREARVKKLIREDASSQIRLKRSKR